MSAAMPLMDWSGVAPERASHQSLQVWELALDPRDHDEAAHILSDPERAFAARLRVGAGAWVAARVALRRVLGRHLGLLPGQVALVAGDNGKPRLAPGGNPDLRFNLSHSGHLALVAVRLGHEVGVDVEAMRPGVDGVAISRDLFSAPERAALAALAGGEPAEGFFRSWVRREALAKATGRGIVTPAAPGESAGFSVRDLDGIPGFAAAIASEGADWCVRRIGAGSRGSSSTCSEWRSDRPAG